MALVTVIGSKKANGWAKIDFYNSKEEEDLFINMYQESLPQSNFFVSIRRQINNIEKVRYLIACDPMFKILKKSRGGWYRARHHVLVEMVTALIQKHKGV